MVALADVVNGAGLTVDSVAMAIPDLGDARQFQAPQVLMDGVTPVNLEDRVRFYNAPTLAVGGILPVPPAAGANYVLNYNIGMPIAAHGGGGVPAPAVKTNAARSLALFMVALYDSIISHDVANQALGGPLAAPGATFAAIDAALGAGAAPAVGEIIAWVEGDAAAGVPPQITPAQHAQAQADRAAILAAGAAPFAPIAPAGGPLPGGISSDTQAQFVALNLHLAPLPPAAVPIVGLALPAAPVPPPPPPPPVVPPPVAPPPVAAAPQSNASRLAQYYKKKGRF